MSASVKDPRRQPELPLGLLFERVVVGVARGIAVDPYAFADAHARLPRLRLGLRADPHRRVPRAARERAHHDREDCGERYSVLGLDGPSS